MTEQGREAQLYLCQFQRSYVLRLTRAYIELSRERLPLIQTLYRNERTRHKRNLSNCIKVCYN
jgi:hypothetical protein